MKKLFDDIWFNDNFYESEKDLFEKIEFAVVDTELFILLYIISPDLLITGICNKIRENNCKTGISDDMLEDVVGPLVHKLFREMWITQKGLKAFLKKLENEIKSALARNPNQIKIDE